ncbi:MAG: carboxypeptidase regulatory-like domain-containing protein [Thermoflexales bacterium]|nr:carboxypeptidase regulatory-like domain-containing protein [Thermoflexales bacterium]
MNTLRVVKTWCTLKTWGATKKWRGILPSLMIIGLLIVGGCTIPTPLPPPTPLPTGGVEGTISDSTSGDPVSNAQVTIAGQAGVFTVMAGDDGKYKANDLPSGAYLVSAQAPGYYVNIAQVGVVANVVSSGNLALEPAAALPPPAPAAMAVAPSATPAPTPTPASTPTPIVITVVVTPIPEPTPTATPTRRASANTQPGTAHSAPLLLEPVDGATFVGPRAITFRWAGSCCLAADEYYVVSIPHPQGVEEAWVKTTAWTCPDYLYLLVPDSRRLSWNVSVRRHTGQYANGQWKGPIVSQLSQTWTFTWHKGSQGPISPLPVPPISPLSP